MVFTTVVGNTTAPNNPRNGPGSPTITYADVKNTTPETTVPIAVNTHALTMERFNLFTMTNRPKNISAVTGLSIKLAIKPPGKVVVNPEIIPVTEPSNRTLLTSANKIIPKNIIVNIMSGFIPNRIGGATACSTAPIPTNSDKTTKFFVFNSHLSSTKLCLTHSIPTMHSCWQRKDCDYYIILQYLLKVLLKLFHKLR